MIENAAQRIGLAIATVCAVIDPELVVLGGRIGGASDLLPAVRATVGRLLPLPTTDRDQRARRARRAGGRTGDGPARGPRSQLFSRERRAAVT